MAVQEGARSDYTVTLEGAGIQLTHTASGISDWRVDVEQVRLATGQSLAVRDVTVSGDAGNNTIGPTLGLARYVDGGAGTDTVVIPATLLQTHVQANGNGSFTLQRMTDGAMLDVTRVERVTFSDTKLALDLNGNAGQAAKLLGALGGPALLANKGVVGEVIRLLDAGATSQTIAGLGLQLLGASTPTQIAQTLWTSVVGRAGTQVELKLLTDIMAGGSRLPS
ncbi:MAG: hypothetical protein V4679_03860 [Pseudomonadota bacterium]